VAEQRAARDILDRLGAHDIDVRGDSTVPGEVRPVR
jgi:hypothetical protein